jgi:hypothetical protein
MRSFGRGNIVHPIVLWVFNAGTTENPRCVVATSASYLAVQRGDEIEFFLQGPAMGACGIVDVGNEPTIVKIENWVRKDGVKETPVDERADPRGAKKALKVKDTAKRTRYKYDIIVERLSGGRTARLDPELEIMP